MYILIAFFLSIVAATDGKPDIIVNLVNNLTINQYAPFTLNQLLMLEPGQYLEQGNLDISFQIAQTQPQQTYNFLVFNLTNSTQQEQYIFFMNSSGQYKQLCQPCSSQCIEGLTTNSLQASYWCCQGCVSETISFFTSNGTALDQLTDYNQVLIIDASPYSSTLTQLPLNVSLNWTISMSTSNSWFYWQVILSCLLVFNIVVLIGVTMHMYLKFKKSTEKLVKAQMTQATQHLKQG